ncbi:MAG: hypothetical protein AB7N70_31965 [Dehalococcoidia bacterium]
MARAAGYEARVWGLSGHVVPEILVDGRWQMFDPDLAVYYKDESGAVAGVEDIVSRPDLITQPQSPIFAGSNYVFPYSTTVRDIYATTADNFLMARTPSSSRARRRRRESCYLRRAR